MKNPETKAEPRTRNQEEMTTSETPLLTGFQTDESGSTDDSTKDGSGSGRNDSGHLSPPRSNDGKSSSESQLEMKRNDRVEGCSTEAERRAVSAPLARGEVFEDVHETVAKPPGMTGCELDEVTLCMCCNDDAECSNERAAITGGERNTTTFNTRNGQAEATTGEPSYEPRPRFEASQSLPTILVPGQPPNQAPPLTAQLDSHKSAPSSFPAYSRVSGVFSDSLLSLPSGDICRICHTGRRHEPLIGPCRCAGSMRYTHQRCLATWLAQSGRSRCELCGYKFRTKMVGSKNILQWKAVPLTPVDRLHLAVFGLSLFLFAGTSAYITWVATGTNLTSISSPASLATQILLPVYCCLSFVSMGLVVYEGRSTCLRLARRWRALNMGVQIMERDISDDVTGGVTGLSHGSRNSEGGHDGEVRSGCSQASGGRVRSTSESQTESTRIGTEGVPSDFSVWSKRRLADPVGLVTGFPVARENQTPSAVNL